MKFNCFNKLELINPKIKNVREINNGIILISESDLKGQRAMIKKIIKKTIPKLLLEPILTSFIKIIYIRVNSTWQPKVLIKLKITIVVMNFKGLKRTKRVASSYPLF